MPMKNKMLGALGLTAACAACCAPLLAPILFGAGVAGLGTSFGLAQLGLSLDEIICAALAVAVIAGGGYWLWRSQKKAKSSKSCNCKTVCDTENCAPAKPA